MQYTHGDHVSLDALQDQLTGSGRLDVEKMQMKEPEGIGGWNPLNFASAQLGEKIVAFCAERIGQKARAALDGSFVPPEQPSSGFMDNPGPTD